LSRDNEIKTRKNLIDPQLRNAHWDISNPNQVGIEIPVDGISADAWTQLREKLHSLSDGKPEYLTLPSGISDYALYRTNGEIIAVVEAKRTSVDIRLAQAQAEFYVTEIEKRQSFRPFAFLANGSDTYFLESGYAARREVAGFFSRDDLENLLYLRQHKLPLGSIPIDMAITDRPYQHEAIRRVSEAFESGKRRALLVMATGTGKTRTTMSVIDVFMRANQARRVLFVADRDALVQQALDDGFHAFLPSEPCTRIFSGKIDYSQRLYVVTLQTLSNVYREFTPSFFDLIVFDEVHRSIFNKFDDVLQYFDGRMIGLTATPAQFIERNTFGVFDCHDGKPTFLYTYEQAIHDKWLVPFSLYSAKTRFQRKGIRGVDLSEEERNALMEQGLDPDEIDYDGTEIEKTVSNRDTLRRQWEEFWDVCHKDESGQLPGKTIVFAMTQDHALRLEEAFTEMYPQFPDLLRVITHESEHRGTLVKRFKKEPMPRIAISVDMLDTGIDVPEVVNLVFMKPVHSQIKLWQMIGRGTRSHAACKMYNLLPNGHKSEFQIIDFWENDFAKAADDPAAQTVPVLVTIWNTRLKLLEAYLGKPDSPERQRVIADLRGQVAQIPLDSFSVKKALPAIQQAWADDFWRFITPDKLRFLPLKVGPLLRYVPDVDVEAATFTSKVERLKLQIETGKDTTATVQSIAEDVSRLPEFVYGNVQFKDAVDLSLSELLSKASALELSDVADRLAPQMKNRRAQPSAFLVLDLRDVIDGRGYIFLTERNEQVYVTEYRERVDKRIQELVAQHPTIQAIQRGEPVSDEQLVALERTLRHELGGSDLELTESNIRKAYGLKVGSLLSFLRQLLEIDALPDYEDVVRRQFEQYIAQHPYTADQINFLRAVQNVFLQKRALTNADLYMPPLTAFGQNAVERLFTANEVQEVLLFTDRLAA
jgi:type I restriction enzyme, R subunit